MKKHIAIALVAAMLTACGGGTSDLANPAIAGPGAAASAHGRSSVTFTLNIPAHVQATSTKRRPLYVSPSIASLVVTLTAQNQKTVTPLMPYAININTSACVTVGGTKTCSISIPAQVGTDTFTVATYDAPQSVSGGTPSMLIGNVLSTASASTTVVANTSNVLALTLNGVVATLVLGLSNQAPAEGSSSTIDLTIAAKDADGNLIIGPGSFANPISLADSDTTGSTTLSTTTVRGPGTAVTIAYTGAPSNATFAASSAAAPPASISLLTQGVGGWATKAPMQTARKAPAAGVVNGIIYAVGGADTGSNALTALEAYDPATDSWTMKAPMPTARQELAVGVVGGIVFAIGGADSSSNALGTVEAYDPNSNTWSSKASLPLALYSMGSAVLNGKIYIIGGYHGAGQSGAVATVEVYDPIANSWSTSAPLPNTNAELSAAEVNGLVYSIDGYIGTGPNPLSAIEAYDAATSSWSSRASDPTPRFDEVAAGLRSDVYVVGGDDCCGNFNLTEAYVPALNTWTTKAPMPTTRFFLAVGVANGILYAIGGEDGSNHAINVLEAYTP